MVTSFFGPGAAPICFNTQKIAAYLIAEKNYTFVINMSSLTPKQLRKAHHILGDIQAILPQVKEFTQFSENEIEFQVVGKITKRELMELCKFLGNFDLDCGEPWIKIKIDLNHY
jgi:hypothetical protein